jgi:hypothetical protein
MLKQYVALYKIYYFFIKFHMKMLGKHSIKDPVIFEPPCTYTLTGIPPPRVENRASNLPAR